MIQFIKSRWQSFLLIIFVVIICLLLSQFCKKQDPSPTYVSTDSVVLQNKVINKRCEALSDSIDRITKKKDSLSITYSNQVKSIKNKYYVLMHRSPVHDTVVKDTVVYRGNEAIEKMPILYRQLDLCQSKNNDLEHKVRLKEEQIDTLQCQFEKVVNIDKENMKKAQANDKKNQRKIKWMKIGLITETVVVCGALIGVLLK